MSVSSPPVLAAEQLENISCKCYEYTLIPCSIKIWSHYFLYKYDFLFTMQLSFLGDSLQSKDDHESFSLRKKIIQMEHRKECLSSVEEVFGNDPAINLDFIVINFFALVRTLLTT